MKQGAEAQVTIKEKQVIKKRAPKNYRNSSIDERIREERTEQELKNIQRARKHNVNVPETEKKSSYTLTQKRINGDVLKGIISKKPGILSKVGSNIARLHSADVIHGDLTTSNIIQGDKIYLIDFGLSYISERIEDKSMDIHLLKKTLQTSHPSVSENAWTNFLKEYRGYEESEKVLERLEEVESRGRYK
jgi:Mn2+-dependent serine/threonine protein kinase